MNSDSFKQVALVLAAKATLPCMCQAAAVAGLPNPTLVMMAKCPHHTCIKP